MSNETGALGSTLNVLSNAPKTRALRALDAGETPVVPVAGETPEAPVTTARMQTE